MRCRHRTVFPRDSLGDLACLIDSLLASGRKERVFVQHTPPLAGAVRNHVQLKGDPIISGTSGQRHFYTDDTHVLRVMSLR